MDVFNLRAGLIEDYQNYVESFIHVADERIRGKVEGNWTGSALARAAGAAESVVRERWLRR